MKRRGTSFKEERTGERNRREGRNGGKADEMEREIRKADLDREREGKRMGDGESKGECGKGSGN